MKIGIIGQGYVGLTVAIYASKKHSVIGFDINGSLIRDLNSAKSHIEGVESKDLKKRIASKRYRATNVPSDISDCDVIVIAVPTPLDANRKPDHSFIDSACKLIGENLSHKALIINESTSSPGTVRNIVKPLVEKYSRNPLIHFYAASPERVDPGRTDWNQKNTARLYAGLTPEATKLTRKFYSSFCKNLIEVSSPEIAEAAKLFENSFRQVNIALVNELAQISHALGISVNETLDAAATKPYGFMKFNPSAGVGGHCIPVDPSYLAHVAAEKGVPATFIQRANEVNLEMPKYIVERVAADNGGTLKGKRVQVIGVSYKPDVADVRETPAELVIDELKAQGAITNWHDPVVKSWHGQESSPLGGSEIAIVVTLHSSMDKSAVLKSAAYVFDTTGKVYGATGL
jgi:UDP-N-acetyl-D-glucosamine dehydrogenase